MAATIERQLQEVGLSFPEVPNTVEKGRAFASSGTPRQEKSMHGLDFSFADPRKTVKGRLPFGSPYGRRDYSIDASPPRPHPSLAQTPPQESSLCSSKSSSFCSFDVGIWEQLHLLDSPFSSAKTRFSRPQSCEKFYLSNIEESVESDDTVSGGVADPSVVSHVKFSVESTPGRRRKSASCSQLDLHAGRKNLAASNVRGGEKIMHTHALSGPKLSLPVLQVVQTGSMSFTNEEAMLQKMELKKLPEVSSKPIKGGLSTYAASGMKKEAMSSSKAGETNLEVGMEGEGEKEEVEEARVGLGAFLPAKFLVQKKEEIDSSPVGTWRTAGCVPFKWEEAPGKPKPCANRTPFEPHPALQLPPRLLNRSEINNGSKRNQSSSKPVPTPSAWQCSSPRKASHPPKMGQSKNLWQSIKAGSFPAKTQDSIAAPKSVHKKEEDPWSPTSILYGPEAGRLSTSSSSSAADGTSIFSSSSSEVQSHANASDGSTKDADQPQSHLQREAINTLSYPYHDSGPRNERGGGIRLKRRVLEGVRILFHRRSMSEKLHGKTRRNRSFREAGMWPPHPATDFRSMEGDREASVSGLFVFGKLSPGEACMVQSMPTRRCESLSSSASFKKETKSQQLAVGRELAYAAGEAANQGVCQSPFCSPSSQLRTPQNGSKWKGGKRIWVLRKLRRGSFYFAAMWRALKRPWRGGESKRQKTPYENLYQ